MKKNIYNIITILAALLVANSAWGDTLPTPTSENHDLNAGTTYVLESDMTPGKEKRWRINLTSNTQEVIVDLNGHTIDAKNIDRAAFNVARGHLTIIDSKGGGKIINSIKSAIYVQPSSGNYSTVNFKGGTIENCKPSDSNGGAFDIRDRGTVNMSDDAIITHCLGSNGAAVYLEKGATFNMSGGQIINNRVSAYKDWDPSTLEPDELPQTTATTGTRGGGVYVDNGTFNMSGGIISGNIAESGGGVFVTSGATFSFTGGIIEGNYAVSTLGASTGNGGGIYIEGGDSNCTINGGTIENNRATRFGGGININGSTMTIPNCTISGNLASSGGGISMETSGSRLNLSGCTLTNNYANVSGKDSQGANGGGGGIFLVDGSLTMSDNNLFQSNTSTVRGGGIYLTKGTLTVSGGTSTFTKNQANSGGAIYHANGNITVAEDATLNLGGSSTEDGNGSTLHGGGIYCAGTITANGTTNIMYNSAGTHGGGIYCTGSFISKGNSTIQNNRAVSYGGGIYMAGDAIKLEGETTNVTANSSGELGGALYVDQGIISITGVSSINNNNAKSGGAVYLNKGSMTTSGTTTVSGNYSTIDGGAVYVYAGKVEMENPTITGNGKNGSLVATSRGGAIFISGLGAEFTATGISDISSNAATSDGGAIYVQGGNVNLQENTISSNTAKMGGAVFLRAGTLNTTVSAQVRNNYATQNGGAFYVVNGKVEMANPTIIDNGKNADGEPVTANGGAIFVLLDSNSQGEVSGFTATGTSLIDSNASTVSGGAICVRNGDVKFSRSTISSNFSKAGGAVYIVGGSLTTTDASTVSGNYSTTNGGAFYVENGKVEMKNPIITGNGKNPDGEPVTANGGAIYVIGSGAGFQAKGETLVRIEDNAALSDGAAVYVSGGNISIENQTRMSGNVAGKNGGVAYVRNGSVTLSANTTMTDNSAIDGSGGVFYVEKSIDYTGTVGVTTKTGTMQSNTSGANGGVFCVNGGNIDLEGKTTMSQNSAVNGGAIAIYNGVFNFADGSEIKANTASKNGGGLYVSSSTLQNISCKGGSYLDNSSSLGGGIYASGPINLVIAANVCDNKAKNGGGLYLDGGVNMTFGGEDSNKNVIDALIVNNSATQVGNDGGIGGGIYLNKGTLSFFFPTDKSKQKLGIYNNVASFEAADIFASGSETTLNLPNVTGMNLTGFDVPGSKLYWVRDFDEIKESDKKYGRYEAALRNLDVDIQRMVLAFEDSESVKKLTNSLQCLDLGYDLVYVTLRPVNLAVGDNAVVIISYPTDRTNPNISNIKQYRKVVLKGGKDAIVGLPSGKWNFDTTQWSTTYPEPIFAPAHVNSFIDVTRQDLKVENNHQVIEDGVITLTFDASSIQTNVVKYDYILPNRMTPKNSSN